MSSETLPLATRQRDEYIYRDSSGSGPIEPEPPAPTDTQTADRTLRMRGLLTPLIVAAAFATPYMPTGIRRLSSAGQRSRSEIVDFDWAFDDWHYSEERGTVAQIIALNSLLALPAREGFSLDLPE